MKVYLATILFLIIIYCGGTNTSSKSSKGNDTIGQTRIDSFRYVLKTHDSTSILSLLTGLWVHEEDSLAVIKIFNNNWSFIYGSELVDSSDIYRIYFLDKLPKFVNEKE